MPSEADQIEAIGLMAAHESALAELYRTYAGQFPEHQDFWSGLAGDEVRHARWVAGFADDVKRGTAEVNPGRFESESMLASLDAVKERRAEAQTGEPSLLDALSSAKKFEDELIESRYFEIFDEDAPELKDLLKVLKAETEVHRKRVTEALEGAKG
jgi:hypothetical protein